ncbi:MAG: toxin-antitoxin system HicB family antitoxin [Chloroflexi bacterium]|nr:toxin-antitoxin system HicB family antitoxin [Chloroflexota bacterium]
MPELPGCITAGETEVEALEHLKEAMESWLLVALERGISIPEPAPQPEREYRGRMLVRMPRTLHRKLAQRAEQEGVSTNQLQEFVPRPTERFCRDD